MIKVKSVSALAYRVPIGNAIKVAFGTFRDRPMVLVHVVDESGAEGWGEVWSNWPAVGAEHRARLAEEIGERLIGRTFESPADAFAALTEELEVLSIQTGEIGPIAQVIAGLDIALWDMTAKMQGIPLYQALGGSPIESVKVYSTGLNPDNPEVFAAERKAEGHRAFKLKVGFGRAIDLRNVAALRETLGDKVQLAVDANQSMSLETAIAFSEAIAPYDVLWFEEPIRVDSGEAAWRRLAQASSVPLAGGENLRGDDLRSAATAGVFEYLQPDVTKWGGLTGNLAIAREAVSAGKQLCPHFFGGGVALLASLHLLAATGGKGLLELDCHPNACREVIVGALLPVDKGSVPVPRLPGLGTVPDQDLLVRYRSWPQLR